MNYGAFTFVFFGLFGIIHGCIELTAEEGVTESFDSHEEYGNATYSSNGYECWLIVAPDGYVISAWTDEFEVERHHDYMFVACGNDGEDGVIGAYHGTQGISSQFPVYTNGSVMFVEFESDYNRNFGGFRVMFTAVNISESNGGDCVSWDDWDDYWDDYWGDESHEDDDESSHSHHGLSGAQIGGIVFGVFLLVIILAAIAACVICCVCAMKTRPKRLVQDYPLHMYPMVHQGMTPVGASTSYAGSTALPPYAGASSWAVTSPTQNQLYGDGQKNHPDQQPDANAPPSNPVSPPPSYEPQTTGHA